MAQQHHLIKRLQHAPNTFDVRSDETIRESSENTPIPSNNYIKLSRPFKPAPHRARRGGLRACDRTWHSAAFISKRTINYDLAESFVDHSTNPLLSDLYKIRFKHDAKQWPTGRFTNYVEKLDKSDGKIMDITCSRSFPITQKKKKTQTIEPPPTDKTSTVLFFDPVDREQKKKLADQQTNFYASFLGHNKIARLVATPSMKKTNGISDSIKTSVPITINSERKEDQLC